MNIFRNFIYFIILNRKYTLTNVCLKFWLFNSLIHFNFAQLKFMRTGQKLTRPSTLMRIAWMLVSIAQVRITICILICFVTYINITNTKRGSTSHMTINRHWTPFFAHSNSTRLTISICETKHKRIRIFGLWAFPRRATVPRTLRITPEYERMRLGRFKYRQRSTTMMTIAFRVEILRLESVLTSAIQKRPLDVWRELTQIKKFKRLSLTKDNTLGQIAFVFV